MKRLLTYLKNYKLYSVMAPLFKCLEACFELFVPLVVARMVDVGISTGSIAYIFRQGGLLILLGLIGLFCSITAQWFAARVAVNTGTALRNDLFTHVLGLSYSELDSIGSATLLTRLTSDINQLQNGVNMFLRLFMRSPFIVLGSVIMALTVDVRGGLVFAVAVPVLTLVVFGILLLSMPLYEKVQKQLDRVMLITKENLRGARVVRAFNRQESEKETFRAENGALVKAQVFVGKISALLNPLTVVIINLAIVFLLYTGAGEVYVGELSQGRLVALVNYMSQILIELIKLANLIIIISKAVACMKRVDAVLGIESDIETFGKSEKPEKRRKLKKEKDGEEKEAYEYRRDTGSGEEQGKPEAIGKIEAQRKKETSVNSGAFEYPESTGELSAANIMSKNDMYASFSQEPEIPLIRFRNVSFAYGRAKADSLSGIDFAVKKGETIGIIGGTGAGKTTLINLIPRFYDVTEGEILLDGRNIKDYELMPMRERIGIVPQRSVLFAGTLRDNMKWGRTDASDEEIYEALTVAQAKEIADGRREGLEFLIEQGGGNLSGGQKQRLAIARALVRRPEILIMDDSASALDFATDAVLRRAIKENTEGMTVFIISQRAGTVKNLDRILVLDEGRQMGFGTHKELLKSCGTYREICLSQMTKEEVMRDEA